MVTRGRTANMESALAFPEQAMTMVQELVAAQVTKELAAFQSRTETRLATQERQITRNSEAIGKVENKIDNVMTDIQDLSGLMKLMMAGQNEMKIMLKQTKRPRTQSTASFDDDDSMEN